MTNARGGVLTGAWVGRCGPGVETLTLFKTQFFDFTIPFITESENLRPSLRNLTQNHTLLKTHSWDNKKQCSGDKKSVKEPEFPRGATDGWQLSRYTVITALWPSITGNNSLRFGYNFSSWCSNVRKTSKQSYSIVLQNVMNDASNCFIYAVSVVDQVPVVQRMEFKRGIQRTNTTKTYIELSNG